MVNKLGSVCSMVDCYNYTQQKNARTFHRFPKDQTICAEWVQRCNRPDLNVVFQRRGSVYLNYNHRICSDHFRISDFTNPNLKSQGLKRGSIPTENLPEGLCMSPVRQTETPTLQTGLSALQVKQIGTATSSTPTILILQRDMSVLPAKELDKAVKRTDTSTILFKPAETSPISAKQTEETDDQDMEPSKEMVEVVVEVRQAGVSGRKAADQTELVKKLRKNLNNAYKRSYKQKVIIRKLRKENAELKEQVSELSPISKLVCENKLSDSFILNQLKQQSKKGKGRRYSTDDKNFALDLYRCSPKAYSMLGSKFCLPTIRLLQLWQQSLNVIPVEFDSE